MAGTNYHIHEMRHYLAHLLRRRPDLREVLEGKPKHATEEEFQEWTQNLPHASLVEICAKCVLYSLEKLEQEDSVAYRILLCIVFLPSEWDVEDACHLAFDPDKAADPSVRQKAMPCIENLLERGLLVPGKAALHYVIPFPVRYSLQDVKAMDSFDWEDPRRRLVAYFAQRAREEALLDPSMHFSWRLPNMLFAFYAAADWFEESAGEPLLDLLHKEREFDAPAELAEALADFGKALGAISARRRSEHAWRTLLAAALGARILGRQELEADLFRLLGHYFRQSERWTEALSSLERARKLYLHCAQFQNACLMSSALALTKRAQGRTDEALLEFERAWTLAAEHNMESERLSIANCAGELCLQSSLFPNARQWFMRGWAAVQSSKQSMARAEVCINLGRAHRAEERLEEAFKWFTEGLRISREEASRPAQAAAYAEIALVWELRGDPSAAIQWFERALSLRCDLSDEPAQAEILCNLARCARLDHRMAEALEYANRSKALARRHALARVTGEVQLELAELALARGNDQDATEAFLGALERLHSISTAKKLGQIHYRLALVLYRRGAVQDAAMHMLVAQALARRAANSPLLAEIDPWVAVLAENLGIPRFNALVDRITDQWEVGGLGDRFQSPPSGKATR